MSERHIQLISQLEKSHKKLGIVLICSVGTLRTASGRGGETTRASIAAGLTYRKSGKLGHMERNPPRWFAGGEMKGGLVAHLVNEEQLRA